MITGGGLGDLIPLSVHEVVAGDSVQGQKEISFNSDVANKLVQNRTYLDIATFYVPYRLIWDEFPTFIIDETGTIPTIAAASAVSTFGEKGGFTADFVPFLRRSYNAIWNAYFRRDDEAEAGTDSGTIREVSCRTNDFFTSLPEGTDASFNIGATVDTMREAVAQDNFNKVRKYYGEKYEDFLKAMGVDAGWSITDEPELIKHTQEVVKANVTKNSGLTTGNELGKLGCSWATLHQHQIPKRFFPEHGLLITVGSWRMQKLFKDTSFPFANHRNKEDFWSPEYDAIKEKTYDGRLWNDGFTGTDPVLPNFEHLRKGMNFSFYNSSNADDDGYFLMDDCTSATDFDDYKETTYPPTGSLFIGDLGSGPGGAGSAVAYSTISRLTKLSPVGTRLGTLLR